MEEISIIANSGSAILSVAYALYNRFGNIKKSIKEKYPKIGKIYDEISPTIEHFSYGFGVTALGYALKGICQESEFLKEFMSLNNLSNSPVENYGLIAGGFATTLDFCWELGQNIERKKFQSAQFLGTCAGVLTGIAVNNLEHILK